MSKERKRRTGSSSCLIRIKLSIMRKKVLQILKQKRKTIKWQQKITLDNKVRQKILNQSKKVTNLTKAKMMK